MSRDAAAFWDALYRDRDPARPGHPHPSLAEVAATARPGSALELGCGDGTTAVWLAEHGWRVTAVDVSQAALDLAAARAERAGVRAAVHPVRGDLCDWTTEETFDLVAALFLHTPFALDRTAVLARAAGRVRAGGSLLIVGHVTLPPWAWDPDDTRGLPRAGELAAALELDGPRWRVERAEEVPRTVTGADGTRADVLDAVLHAVRES